MLVNINLDCYFSRLWQDNPMRAKARVENGKPSIENLEDCWMIDVRVGDYMPVGLVVVLLTYA
jgi:hypothetical protein